MNLALTENNFSVWHKGFEFDVITGFSKKNDYTIEVRVKKPNFYHYPLEKGGCKEEMRDYVSEAIAREEVHSQVIKMYMGFKS